MACGLAGLKKIYRQAGCLFKGHLGIFTTMKLFLIFVSSDLN